MFKCIAIAYLIHLYVHNIVQLSVSLKKGRLCVAFFLLAVIT